MTIHERNRVLITGADGFTGRYVWAACEAAGYQPVAPLNGFNLSSVESCRLSLQHTRPDYLIHLAAISFVAHPDQSELYQVNTVGTINLLHALLDVELIPRNIIIASSANVYGNVPLACQPITEEQPLAPENHYAASKSAMEHLVNRWYDKFPIIITRPFNYTGVGQAQQFLVPKLVKHFVDREPIIKLGNLGIARDYSDVRDVAAMYVELLNAPAFNSKIVNICSGNLYKLSEILKLLTDITNHTIEVITDPSFTRSNEISTICGSSEKLLRLQKYSAKYSFKETLSWMLGI
jgi:GDP-6-deoxy-D-talose 4-dehydrogenase